MLCALPHGNPITPSEARAITHISQARKLTEMSDNLPKVTQLTISKVEFQEISLRPELLSPIPYKA